MTKTVRLPKKYSNLKLIYAIFPVTKNIFFKLLFILVIPTIFFYGKVNINGLRSLKKLYDSYYLFSNNIF